MLIQHATLIDGTVTDIRLGERIHATGDLTAQPAEQVLDAAHGTVIPGLHDHHVHLHSAAAALTSVGVGPADVHGRDGLARALTAARPGSDGWIRAVGYHEAVAGPLDRTTLDEIAPAVPVRVQHRSGVLWTLNSAALTRVGLADHPDGRLPSADPRWSESLQRNDTGLAELSRRLSRYGVTGVTDATPDLGADGIVKLTEQHRHRVLRQRVHFLAPGKRILHDDQLDLDALTDWIADRHDDGGTVAVHCVTAAQLVVTLAALRAAGTRPGDRIEHAAVVPDDCIDDLVDLGVTVVTQPNFVAERGDQYLADVPADEYAQLWRLASLHPAKVALSTDLPFGDADPWAAMRAAVHRTTPGGAVLGPDERVPPEAALQMFFGEAARPAHARTIAPGQPGDLCLLDAPPGVVLRELDAGLVSATLVGGEQIFQR